MKEDKGSLKGITVISELFAGDRIYSLYSKCCKCYSSVKKAKEE